MNDLDYYKKANLKTLIPIRLNFKDKSTKLIMIPKIELWYISNDFSGHKASGFKFNKLQQALSDRKINYYTASFNFI